MREDAMPRDRVLLFPTGVPPQHHLDLPARVLDAMLRGQHEIGVDQGAAAAARAGHVSGAERDRVTRRQGDALALGLRELHRRRELVERSRAAWLPVEAGA